jgi:hypothetical protein
VIPSSMSWSAYLPDVLQVEEAEEDPELGQDGLAEEGPSIEPAGAPPFDHNMALYELGDELEYPKSMLFLATSWLSAWNRRVALFSTGISCTSFFISRLPTWILEAWEHLMPPHFWLWCLQTPCSCLAAVCLLFDWQSSLQAWGNSPPPLVNHRVAPWSIIVLPPGQIIVLPPGQSSCCPLVNHRVAPWSIIVLPCLEYQECQRPGGKMEMEVKPFTLTLIHIHELSQMSSSNHRDKLHASQVSGGIFQ